MRDQLSHKWIQGSGIEIGALHFPLSVKPGVRVTYVDRMPLEELRKNCDVNPAQLSIIVDDAETLSTFENESQDFVIANHVFEHTEDPIGTLENWLRVLKLGGIVYAAIPDKRFTFDRKRPITPFSHLIMDHVNGTEGSRMDHYLDWFENSDFPDSGVNVRFRAEQAFVERSNIHFHVWDDKAIAEMVQEFKMRLGIRETEIHQNGAEVIVILKK